MKNKFYYFGLMVVLSMTACSKDLGEYIQVRVDSPDFIQLRNDAAVDIILTQGNDYSIDFEGYELIFDDLEFRVINHKLIIDQHGHYWSSRKAKVYITVPDLTRIEITSSGDIYGDNRFRINGDLELKIAGSGDMDLNLDVKELFTTVQGSGNLYLKGYTDLHELELDGSGEVRAYSLNSRHARVTSYGSGDAEIYAQKTLNARVRGSGNVYFIGYPAVDYSVTGSGSLIDSN